MTLSHAYANLSPDDVLNTIESFGFNCDGRMLALNSYENRVYRLGLDDGGSVVAKFYRPGRWSDAAILEEHAFTAELAALEVPVVAPMEIDGRTLLSNSDFRVAVFANRGGRAPDLEDYDQLEQMGRFMGRIHRAGQQRPFTDRPTLDIESFGHDARNAVLASDLLPAELRVVYESLTEQLLHEAGQCYERAGDVELIRCHGDCHPSNVLWTADGPHIVDFDDARMAPAVQDLWMFLAGDRADRTAALDAVLAGYTEFCEFDARQLHLIEALRTLRLIHYYGWLTRRWEDPAFKLAFPWFNTQRSWEDHILSLREQAALLHEPALHWMG
ncbi:MAG: serine/threonine protein kinase [Gammaproteobacteria bacterium]|nr:serine/threonine protein kinase [Gammaproteobacteria bacterium]